MNVETLLREVFAPVEPPGRLSERLESRLAALTQAAQEELDGWELAAMRNPRNWMRPVLAGGVTVSAGTALVLLRMRGRRDQPRNQSEATAEQLERAFKHLMRETRRILPGR